MLVVLPYLAFICYVEGFSLRLVDEHTAVTPYPNITTNTRMIHK
jgi:hypothetical protein